ncbi:MAG TPA: hypothetical protein VFE51_11450 [Verrucomicrobiae bacterium]|nr:hypothetical protein [Verrucomicrobiae bacterium]
MKTNPVARYLVLIRLIMVCAALTAIGGVEFYLGASLAARIGQTTARQDQDPQTANVDVADFMAFAQ